MLLDRVTHSADEVFGRSGGTGAVTNTDLVNAPGLVSGTVKFIVIHRGCILAVERLTLACVHILLCQQLTAAHMGRRK